MSIGKEDIRKWGGFFRFSIPLLPHASVRIRLKIAVRFEIDGRGEFSCRETRALATRRNEVKLRF
jgi:hypothetical protein